MRAFYLRGLPDEAVAVLVARLEDQVRYTRDAPTALGRQLHEQYLAALTAARLERDRRAGEE